VGTKSDDLFGAETEPERYQLVQELASGGMATVFLARTRDSMGAPQLVAVKRIHRHLAREQSFVEMFFDEARIAAQIRHPNVCTLFDFGRSGAVFYIAMEYVLGETLLELIRVVARDRRLRESPRWQVYAATAVADACEGLHAVHELTDDEGRPMRVVHRDISPNNVFVTYEGAVKVVDFGIAYAQNKMHHTQTGTLKGKVGYMPPELIVGDGRDVDRRADIWALGVCLWELLAGALLFQGHNDAATMFNVMQRQIPSLRSVAGVPARLDEIVARAIERERTGRYQTARELGRDLRSWIASTGVLVEADEIAAFMQTRFAPQYARKLDVLEAAPTAAGAVGLGELVDDLITRQLPLASPSAPNPDTAELMQPAESADSSPGPLSAGSGPVKAAAPSIRPPPDRRRGRWAAFSVAIGGAVLAVGGTGLALWQQGEDVGRDGPALAVATRGPPAAPVEDTRPGPAEPAATPIPPPSPAAPEPAIAAPDQPSSSAEPADGEAAPPEEPAATEDDEPGRSSRRKRAREKARSRARQRSAEHRRASVEAKPAPPDPADPPGPPGPPDSIEESPDEPPVAEPDPAPEPKLPAPPPPTPPRRTGPLAASASVASLEVQGSLVNSMVSRAIDRVMPSLRTCYRDAAVAAGKNARCSVRVKLSINETGQVARATAAGGQLPGLDACVQGVAMRIRTLTRPDVGGATASFEVKYKPQGD